jgi:hypothetical protein
VIGALTGCAPMKKFVGLLLCLSLSSFIVTRAAKPTHALRSQKEITSQEPYAKSASFDMSDADQDQIAADQDADEQDASGDNNQNASGNEGVNDQQGGAADAGEQDTADDAEAVDTGTDDADDGGGE